MVEDAEQIATTTPESTGEGSQSYADALTGEGTTPKDSPGGESEETPIAPEKKPDEQSSEAPPVDDPEIVVEIGGQSYTGKQSVIAKMLGLLPSFSDSPDTLLDGLTQAEKLAAYKKEIDRGSTQKFQEASKIRTSFEKSFGRVPEQSEIDNLGRVYQEYFRNPEAKAVIDAIVSGQSVRQVLQGVPSNGRTEVPQNSSDPYVQQLQSEIAGLKSELQQFTNSFSREKELKAREETAKTWNAWTASKKEQGIVINEDIDAAMAPFVTALSQSHPDWDDSKILDESYKHATLGTEMKKAVAQVLTSAEKAKKGQPPKITPKSGQVPDTSKGYGDIILEG